MVYRDLLLNVSILAARSPIRFIICVVLCAVLVSACSFPAEIRGLRLIDPEPTTGATKLNSLRPTLTWESFEHFIQRTGGRDIKRDAYRDVQYELRIWRTKGIHLIEQVYERRNLAEPKHRLDRDLRPNTEYGWTVRARFLFDGNPRVSEWSIMKGGSGLQGSRRSRAVPNPSVIRFRTPPEDGDPWAVTPNPDG
jgi:hypothetical protein